MCLASLSLSGRCNECRVQKPVRFMGHMSVGNVVPLEVSVKVKYLSCFIDKMNKVKLLHYDILIDCALAPKPFSHPRIWDRRNLYIYN